jgi:hypothetical protein
MARWAPALTEERHSVILDLMNETERGAEELRALIPAIDDQALAVAEEMNQKFPGLPWLLERDAGQGVRLTLFFPPPGAP